jgi:hypothetical protein
VSAPEDGFQDDAPAPRPATFGEQLERTVVLRFAHMGNSRVLVPLAAAGLSAEKSLRRLGDGALTALCHFYRLPTRREVRVLQERVSALRYRVTELQLSADPPHSSSRSRR